MADGIIKFDEGYHLDAGWHLDQPAPLPPALPVPVRSKKTKGIKHMDFIPNKRAENKAWWTTIKETGAVELAKINLPAPDIAAAVATATNQVAKMQATDDAEAVLNATRAMEKTAEANNEAAIRLAVRNWKTNPAYAASGIEGSLKLKGPVSGFDPTTFKTVLKLSIVGGQIRVDFIKDKCDSVAVYCRLRGTATWTKLGNDSRSPYYDTKPLADPNVPEVREYIGIGVIDDVEIGVPSDIVSIVFGG
jgi:hypothetical protein